MGRARGRKANDIWAGREGEGEWGWEGDKERKGYCSVGLRSE